MKNEADWVKTLDLDSWSGKTSPVPSPVIKEQISVQSSRKQRKSSVKKPPLFLSLIKDGQQQDASMEWNRGGVLWSIAWRVFDAQFWGVPQRRRRIALVADFGGNTAPEILFERKSVSGDFEESEEQRKASSRNAKDSFDRNDNLSTESGESLIPCTLKIRSGCSGRGKGALIQMDKSATLSTLQDQTLFAPVYCIQGNCIDRADTAGCNGKGWKEGTSYTLNTVDRPAVSYPLENHPNDSRLKISDDGVVQTLSGRMGTGGGNTPMILECYSQDAYDKYTHNEISATLKRSGGIYGGVVKR